MRRFSLAGNERGMTLVELLVAGAIASVVLASLCGVYFLVGKEWDRQHSKEQAITAVSDATSRLSSYIAAGVYAFTQDHFMAGDALVVCMPSDSGYGGYVPVWDGPRYHYRQGTWVIFYLSDKTGSYYSKGDILWAGTITDWGTFPQSIVPDTSWSLHNQNTGKLSPITSLSFSVTENGYRTSVTMQVGSTYSIGKSQVSFSHMRVQSLRNEHPI